MKLSIVIVSYNVRYFLEQTLLSVQEAIKGIEAEVFVVDNASADDSVDLVREKFPEVICIANTDNVGFSKANNQAIRQAKGEYILLLNPDTVVEPQTFSKCLAFMDQHPKAGGLGVKMVDGSGRFLPESKRGLPLPWVAFYKVFGLARLFPKSKRFGRYHLTFLNPDETHEVDILSGAFMFLRKATLDTTGLLDESFFMYGEDIDLSYRIQKAGYQNYYFPETRIIHYKGESTKKSSVNYVLVFYRAMMLFANKHFSQSHAGVFGLLIHMAIWFRAALAIARRIVTAIGKPFLDIAIAYAAFIPFVHYWESHYKPEPGPYPSIYLSLVIPVYLLVWSICLSASGWYKRPSNLFKLAAGIFTGVILLSALSNFVEPLRFSRGILLGGAIILGAIALCNRILLSLRYRDWTVGSRAPQNLVFVCSENEWLHLQPRLKSGGHEEIKGFISTHPHCTHADCLGSIQHMNDLIGLNRIQELVFNAADLSADKIIDGMMAWSHNGVSFKILPKSADYLIGSHSKNDRGDLYSLELRLKIASPEGLKAKRSGDLILSFLVLAGFPLFAIISRAPQSLWKNLKAVFSGKASWVGYSGDLQQSLPLIKKGILDPGMNMPALQSGMDIERLNYLYARDYSPMQDVGLFLKNLKHLGKSR